MQRVEDKSFSQQALPVFEPDTRYENCRFENLDFSTLDITSVAFTECQFIQCKLPNQKLLNTSLRNVVFEECNLLGINWCALKSMQDVNFLTCKLDFGIFQELKLNGTQIKGCSARETDFSEADLSHAILSNTDFTGATFSNARLAGADFRQSHGYVFDLRTTNIRKTKFSLPDISPLIIALGAEIEY